MTTELLVTIKEKRRGNLTKVPHSLLLRDNTSAHGSHVAQAVGLLKCGFEEMCHPPYSADQTQSDYHLFSNLKKNLRGQRFLTDDELNYAPEERLKGQSELFHFTGNENPEIITNRALTKVATIEK